MDQARKFAPDLILAVISTSFSQQIVDTGQSLSEHHFPVVYVTTKNGQSALQRAGILDPFARLSWPADEAVLQAHLEMALQKAGLERRVREFEQRQGDNCRYRSLFEDSPISLWEEDFSAVKHSVEEIKRQGVTDLRAYFTAHPEALANCRSQLRVLDVNQATLRMYQAASKEELMRRMDMVFDERVMDLMLEEMVAIGEGKTCFEGDGINRDLAGNYLDIHISWSASPGSEGDLSNVIVSITNVTERKRREDVLKVIASINAAIRPLETRAEMLPVILRQVMELVHATTSALVLRDEFTGNAVIELANGEWSAGTGMVLTGRINASETILTSCKPYINPDIRSDPRFQLKDLVARDRSVIALPLQTQQRSIGVLWLGRAQHFTAAEIELLQAVTDIVANAIHRTTLHEKTRRSAEQVATVAALGRALSSIFDPEEIYARLAQGVLDLLPDLAGVYLSTFDSQKKLISFVYGVLDGQRMDFSSTAPVSLDSPWAGSQAEVIRTHQPLIINDLHSRRRVAQTGILSGTPAVKTQSGIYVPMLAQDEITGVLFVQSYRPDRFSQADAELLTLVGNTGAIALHTARLFTATQRQLQRLTALHAIDVAISSSLDLRITLNILLDQLTALLHLDAADILMLDSGAQTLEYAAGRGFRSPEMTHTRMKLGEGLAGQAALKNHIFTAAVLSPTETSDRRAPLLAAEGIQAYSAAPLVTKGQVKGVLEIFHRAPQEMDAEWQDFLETLAGQVAVAIDNAALVSQLQRTNLELTLAYDRTLEGWSLALSIRDKDTEDHTRRVTELTVQLARAMGLSDAELVQVRRGALLHDIGKLGIPDGILLKTGPLDEGEREVIQRHPIYAYEMLKSIDFLAPARDIPYCHHERWDGTGYPRGLKGEEIPLGARIFSVIDVWDSLCHDRPYRKAWPVEKAREYIQAHSGQYFDPHVVQVFLKMIG